MNTMKNIINEELQNIQLGDDIKMMVLNSQSAKKKWNFKPLAIAIACTCVISTFGVGVIASGGVREFIKGTEIIFQPVNESCTYDGITLTVQSAGKQDRYMIIYLTLQDTTNQNRINSETLVATNSNIVDGVATENWTCIAFDENTNTAYYKVIVEASFWSNLLDKCTLNANLLMNISEPVTHITDTDLYDLIVNKNLDNGYTTLNQDDNVDCYSYSGFEGCYKSRPYPTDKKYLNEIDEPIQIDDDVSIFGIGFIDEHLHIKLRFSNTFNEPNIKLLDIIGNVISDNDKQSSIASYWDNDYITLEVCFPKINDISKLKDLRLSYDTQPIEVIEGNWAVTLNLEDTIE